MMDCEAICINPILFTVVWNTWDLKFYDNPSDTMKHGDIPNLAIWLQMAMYSTGRRTKCSYLGMMSGTSWTFYPQSNLASIWCRPVTIWVNIDWLEVGWAVVRGMACLITKSGWCSFDPWWFHHWSPPRLTLYQGVKLVPAVMPRSKEAQGRPGPRPPSFRGPRKRVSPDLSAPWRPDTSMGQPWLLKGGTISTLVVDGQLHLVRYNHRILWNT